MLSDSKVRMVCVTQWKPVFEPYRNDYKSLKKHGGIELLLYVGADSSTYEHISRGERCNEVVGRLTDRAIDDEGQ